MTESEALELREQAAHLEAENAKWRARHCRANRILLGDRPAAGVALGGLERRALALLDRAEKAERERDALMAEAEADAAEFQRWIEQANRFAEPA